MNKFLIVIYYGYSLKLVKRTNSKLTLFTAPYCTKIKNREKLKELKNAIPGILDYVSLFDDKEEYFFNCAHLNIDGAHEFTKILMEDISSVELNESK
ncbi:MAG: hypothetical protein P8K68_04310 [Algibacter sp.]|uniref:hypothetical protein n=1 Tax=Algibacter sp. TaxID=1872428 RepID=UPI0026272FD5|nr:hypothetical protein [Algibacter sp.]MDG1729844.1 hypothetical protein [Algibacter sp.]MDG2177998.1 hypothetical protein [Algibacter sp.]